MENQADIQMQLLQKIRDQLPDHVSLVEDIAELLEISNDSAYRRIRGEKQLSLQEVKKLCQHYRFSIDDLAGNSSIKTVTFRINILNELNFFQIIQVPEVCAFKLFFWQKSNLDFANFKNISFSLELLDKEIYEISHKIIDQYVKIKTIELTTEECLNSYLKQILYYTEAGYFETRNDALIICEKLLELVNHKQKQAELGFKFPFGKHPVGEEGNFHLYHNDIILADNTVLIKAGNVQTSFITSNAINIMQTHNKEFYQYNYGWGRNLMAKFVLISGTAEKERSRFFRKLKEQISSVADQI
jgi:hypothetical protein